MEPGLEEQLRGLLNRFSQDNDCNTPDYILAMYLLDSLAAYKRAVKERDRWYDFKGLNASAND